MTKVRFDFMSIDSWSRPGQEKQICFSVLRRLPQARWRKTDLHFCLSSRGPGPVAKDRFAFLSFVIWLCPSYVRQIFFSVFRHLPRAI